jgi:hypothetical protein
MLTVAGKLECCTSDKTPCPVYQEATEVQIWDKNKSEFLLVDLMKDF